MDVVEPPKSAPQYMLDQQDDRRDRVHGEGQRQQQRHAVWRAEAGQNTHEDSQQDADDHQRT